MPHTTLVASQLAEYYEWGYVVVADVFPRAELEEINREMDHILEGQAASYKEGGTCNLGIDTRVDLENRVYLPVSPGSIVLFSALLWHASDGNASGNRRRAFIVSYQEAVVQGGNANQWIILRPA